MSLQKRNRGRLSLPNRPRVYSCRDSKAFERVKREAAEMSAAHARLTIIKKNDSLGGVCPMEDSQLIIGRRAPLQHSYPAPSPTCERAAPRAESCVPHRNRDPESCDIQIRLPEVSKRQAKIVSDNEDKVTELHTQTLPAPRQSCCQQPHHRAPAGLAR